MKTWNVCLNKNNENQNEIVSLKKIIKASFQGLLCKGRQAANFTNLEALVLASFCKGFIIDQSANNL